jgi:hypothetical protein
MKHKYTTLSLIAIAGMVVPFFGVAAQKNAELNATTSRKGEFKSAIDQKREDLRDAQEKYKDEVKQKKEEFKSELKDKKELTKNEFRMDLAKKKTVGTVRVLTATTARLETLISRIESRIQKIKTAGGNTATAEASVRLARTDIVKARAHISAISAIDISTSSTTAKINFEKIKVEAKLVKESLHSAHKNLSIAVSSLKSSEKGLNIKKEKATSTDSEN